MFYVGMYVPNFIAIFYFKHTGYDWVGWKKKSNDETLDLVFTFDQVRTFDKIVIHINNHFTKDIQVFKTAKVYFSNEEDKFADDRYTLFHLFDALLIPTYLFNFVIIFIVAIFLIYSYLLGFTEWWTFHTCQI